MKRAYFTPEEELGEQKPPVNRKQIWLCPIQVFAPTVERRPKSNERRKEEERRGKCSQTL